MRFHRTVRPRRRIGVVTVAITAALVTAVSGCGSSTGTASNPGTGAGSTASSGSGGSADTSTAGSSGASGDASGGALSEHNENGTIKLGSMFPPGTLDPTTGTQGSDLAYLDYIFDRLIQQDPNTGELKPMLATSWKFIGDDKLKLEVNLRKGVKFQDGTPFNAQAVVDYSKAFIAAGNIANLLEYVTDVTAKDDDTVIYHLSQPNAQLPMGLTARAGMIPSPTAVKKEGKDFAIQPVGTGPYKFVSMVQGANYKFTRFDGYWDNDDLPRVKNVEFDMFQSDTALVNAIRSGEVNAALHLLPQDVKTLKPLSNLDVEVSPANAIGIAYLNASRKPLDDKRVRLAINLALDRGAIADVVTDGTGQPVTQSLPAGAHGYIKDMEPVWTQNVDKAKQLMADAGYADGVKLSCYAYVGLGFETAGPIIIAQLKKIGIDLTISPATPAQVGPFFTNKTKQQCAFANWGSTDPFKAYQLLWSQSFYNAGKVDFGIDDDIAKFYTAYDKAGEDDIVKSILTTEKTNPGYVPIFRAPVVNVYQKDVTGWTKSQLGIGTWRGIRYSD